MNTVKKTKWQDISMLTIEEVCEVVKVSKPTIYRKVKNGTFPAPTKIPTTAVRGPKMVNRWHLSEIREYCAEPDAPETTETIEAPEPWYVVHRHALTAVVGGGLAAAAYALFG